MTAQLWLPPHTAYPIGFSGQIPGLSFWSPVVIDSSQSSNVPASWTQFSGGSVSSAPYSYTPQGYEQMTSLGTATGFTTIPANAKYAFITVSGAIVRYRDDGTAPTASLGVPIPINTQLQYFGNLSAIEFIQESAGAVLDVAFYS